MDESINCKCGHNIFWYFGEYSRCIACYREYKMGDNGPLYTRSFNKKSNSYRGWKFHHDK